MKIVDLSIGPKKFSIQCEERDVTIINNLGKELNIIINKNLIKYRGLSEDNLFLITTLEILSERNKLKSDINSLKESFNQRELFAKNNNIVNTETLQKDDSVTLDLEDSERIKELEQISKRLEEQITQINKVLQSTMEK